MLFISRLTPYECQSRECFGIIHKFSGVEMEVDQYTAVITGTLTHNGSTKKNLRLSIPCFDKKGNRVGDAIATYR